jgi:uncharacterized protein
VAGRDGGRWEAWDPMAPVPPLTVRDCHMTVENEDVQLQNEQLFSRGNQRLRDLSLRHRHDLGGHGGDASPADLAAFWTSELDAAGVAEAVILSGSPATRDFTHAVMEAGRGRLLGFTCLDPLQTWSAEDLQKDVGRGFVGLILRPTLQHFHLYDRRCYGLFEACERMRLPVMVHMGLTDSLFADLRFGNPLDLQPVARDFPDVPFIVGRLGSGFFRELLMLAGQARNVYVDTAGTHMWLRYQPEKLTLDDAFRRLLDIAGPERLLFGTDSRDASAGYRVDLLKLQSEVLGILSDDERRLVLGGNLESLLASLDRSAAAPRTSRLMLRRWGSDESSGG